MSDEERTGPNLEYVDPVIGSKLRVHVDRRGFVQLTIEHGADSGQVLAVRIRDEDLVDLVDVLKVGLRERRRRFTSDVASEVARIYVDNVASGKPTKAVREHFQLAESTASLYVKRARPEIEELLGRRSSDG